MDQLTAMRVFVRIVQTESFAKTADQLQMPRSTVSKLMADLENHLHCKLLTRTTRQLSLTAEGQSYYQHAQRLIADIDHADNLIRGQQCQISGLLRVDVPALFAHQSLIPQLPDFAEKYPAIQLNLGIGDRLTDLIGEGVDCVIRAGKLQDLGLIARPLCQLPFVTCASKAYLAKYGIPQNLQALEKHRIVGYFSQQTGKNKALIFEQNGETIEYKTQHYCANEGNGLIAMLQAGLGIGQVFRPYVQAQLDSGELIEVLPDWQHPDLTFYLVYPPNKHQNLRLTAFVEWLMATYRKARE
ncbi:LysR family transcriptional regulator [Volucribacter amazonae]|uniref:LysR family transcriptional regulator n=1 Tax=Volucribacter amazonae TaxID=256731 RepID=A0A9X4PDN5_9PAST|nr:LysR family transcriptional regulator [Volucribacter amazonae]MDG6895339.1 LysR family transcriptional regulator [Volucribacter amazonae]